MSVHGMPSPHWSRGTRRASLLQRERDLEGVKSLIASGNVEASGDAAAKVDYALAETRAALADLARESRAARAGPQPF